jgi:hypothetical protein
MPVTIRDSLSTPFHSRSSLSWPLKPGSPETPAPSLKVALAAGQLPDARASALRSSQASAPST